jgi:hypothetical protein
MKKTFFLAGIVSLLLTVAVNAQQDSTKPMQQDSSRSMQDSTKQMQQQPAQTQPTTTPEQTKSTTTTTVEQKKYGNPTVDSILSKYTLVPMPNPITTEQIFPVIGQYQSTTSADQKISVTLDDQNKGYAWVDGLPQGKVKAILKASPATYKIPAQKTEGGTDVPEGTLIYNKDTKTISVMLGREFNDQDPASVFANATASTEDQSMATNDEAKMNDQSKANVTKVKGHKTKTKVAKVEKKPEPWVFTGTKIEQGTAANQ